MDLGDINLDAVGEMLSSLSDEDMESITRLASDMLSGAKQTSGGEKAQESSTAAFDMETVMKMASVLSRLNSQPEDPGCRLLRDLKPMLSPARRPRVDKAIQMLRIVSLMPLIRELG
ncbi:MAG: hypothetical protein IKJ27_09240 [Clostridia bacterium]|nr:hypothetical protein [Clostridia bacterium]